ncbi:MAG TPA: hypothetical protein V6D18_13440 [Thermosynechococcaceae cyanobacterium]
MSRMKLKTNLGVTGLEQEVSSRERLERSNRVTALARNRMSTIVNHRQFPQHLL